MVQGSAFAHVNAEVEEMAPVLSFLIGSLLAARGLAEPFEKLFAVPEGRWSEAPR